MVFIAAMRYSVDQLNATAEKNGRAVIFTFAPHPLAILRPELAPIPLCWLERKVDLLGKLGIEHVVAYPTDMELLKLTPRDFFEKIVVDQLAASAIIEGPNFCFGARPRWRSKRAEKLMR